MVLMVVLTLEDLKKPKRKKQKKETWGGRQKKDKRFKQARKASNKWANKDFIVGGWDFWAAAHINFGENWGFFN